jgi:hypothetical protein
VLIGRRLGPLLDAHPDPDGVIILAGTNDVLAATSECPPPRAPNGHPTQQTYHPTTCPPRHLPTRPPPRPRDDALLPPLVPWPEEPGGDPPILHRRNGRYAARAARARASRAGRCGHTAAHRGGPRGRDKRPRGPVQRGAQGAGRAARPQCARDRPGRSVLRTPGGAARAGAAALPADEHGGHRLDAGVCAGVQQGCRPQRET